MKCLSLLSEYALSRGQPDIVDGRSSLGRSEMKTAASRIGGMTIIRRSALLNCLVLRRMAMESNHAAVKVKSRP